MEKTSYVIGLMSGTSLDGVDVALIKITSKGKGNDPDLALVHFASFPYDKNVKDKLLLLCQPDQARIEDISMMNMYLGELFSEWVMKVLQEKGLTSEDILLISSHGQTIFHQPNPVSMAGQKISSTLQIGDIGMIAERTGITTIGDFRTRDMAAGGQGAPLVAFADYLLFKNDSIGRALVNIGGIANATILPKNAQPSDVLAFDTGPGNMLIDFFTSWATKGAESYDKDGQLAAKGKVHEEWLQQLLQHEYFHRPVPKTTGREMFGEHFAKQLRKQADRYEMSDVDKIATITALTARTTAKHIRQYVNDYFLKEVLVSGGGSYNLTLMEKINDLLPKCDVQTSDTYGIPADAKEAIAFALLGYQCYHKQPNNLPSATGAHRSVVMGKIAW